MVRFFTSEDGAARLGQALPAGGCVVALLVAGLTLGLAGPAAAWDCWCNGCYMDAGRTMVITTIYPSAVCTQQPYIRETQRMYCNPPDECDPRPYTCVASQMNCVYE